MAPPAQRFEAVILAPGQPHDGLEGHGDVAPIEELAQLASPGHEVPRQGEDARVQGAPPCSPSASAPGAAAERGHAELEIGEVQDVALPQGRVGHRLPVQEGAVPAAQVPQAQPTVALIDLCVGLGDGAGDGSTRSRPGWRPMRKGSASTSIRRRSPLPPGLSRTSLWGVALASGPVRRRAAPPFGGRPGPGPQKRVAAAGLGATSMPRSCKLQARPQQSRSLPRSYWPSSPRPSTASLSRAERPSAFGGGPGLRATRGPSTPVRPPRTKKTRAVGPRNRGRGRDLADHCEVRGLRSL